MMKQIILIQNQSTSIIADIIAKETLKYPELQEIIKSLQSESEDSTFTFSLILFRQDRIIIPKNLRVSVLKELPSTHSCIIKMKQLARRNVY